ncbi:MAG: DNA repair protein RadA [Candidatus Komeilibacteria bacterium]|nr:DNA repair protein RadA [Candidatus Komeilibacteria bacterium]
MIKNKKIFICAKCDAQYPKWTGRCLECGGWGTIQEDVVIEGEKKSTLGRAAEMTDLSQVDSQDLARIQTGLAEWDGVLGGGIVRGSLVLLGGDPGIGKSTLALQIAVLAKKTVYVSGEESEQQVAQRSRRLTEKGNISFLAATNVEDIIATLRKNKPTLAVIDSIQTMYSHDIAGEAGSVSQVRGVTVKLLEIAKRDGIAIILIGHVTKEGAVAGPKTLEHLVDAVLYLEGDKYQQYRLLRSVKNRFGATGEVGVWEMTSGGLRGVKNPAAVFIEHRQPQSGSIITAVAEGSRIFLVEVQALVNKTSYGYPRRLAVGFSNQRLEIILAVLTKKLKLPLGNYDVYINVAGGMNLREPAMDLAVATAILSAFYDKILAKESLVFGEIGLGGELRPVVNTKERIKEAMKLGFTQIHLPALNIKVSLDKVKLKQHADLSSLVKEMK